MPVHDAPNYLHINAVWMVISVDKDGNEGVVAVPLGTDMLSVPLIAADEARLGSIIKMAEQVAGLFPHKSMKLIKLSTREEVQVIIPARVDGNPVH